ncbi:MAG: helix-hairpin-helix domain-containing protein, partial [Betaproteobacteria bacterium]|nr:helix-hairpin-helix domain-containing protein [Betaproteobacteria bacterium]
MLRKLLLAVAMIFATTLAFAAVDINKATQAELESIKGIGPVTAKEILDERQKGGAFKDWNDVMSRVKGVKEKRSAEFSAGGLTVNGKAMEGAPAAAKAAPKKEEKAAAKAETPSAKPAAPAAATAAPAAAAKPAEQKAEPKKEMTAAEKKAAAKKEKEDKAQAAKEAKAKAKA